MNLRRSLLAIVAVLAILLLLVRVSEGAAKPKVPGSCRISYVAGGDPAKPPLSAKDCNGLTFSRSGACWTAKDGQWVKDDKKKKCTSWTKAVNWKNKDVQNQSKTTIKLVDRNDYVKYSNKDLKDGSKGKHYFELSPNNEFSSLNACADKCNEYPECVGFTFDKSASSDGKFKCYGRKPEGDRKAGQVETRLGNIYFRKKSNSTSAGGSSSNKSQSGCNLKTEGSGGYTTKINDGNDWVCPEGSTDTGCNWGMGPSSTLQCRFERPSSCLKDWPTDAEFTARENNENTEWKWVCPKGYLDTGCDHGAGDGWDTKQCVKMGPTDYVKYLKMKTFESDVLNRCSKLGSNNVVQIFGGNDGRSDAHNPLKCGGAYGNLREPLHSTWGKKPNSIIVPRDLVAHINFKDGTTKTYGEGMHQDIGGDNVVSIRIDAKQ